MDTGFIEYKDKNGYEFAKACECREMRILENKLIFANIPNEFNGYTVQTFDTSIYSSPDAKEKAEMAKVLCVNYVNNFESIRIDGKGLYMYSRTKGSGKTRMAASIANDIIKRYRVSSKFATTLQILDEIKRSWQEHGEESGEHRFLEEIIRVPVLVIDDIGVEKPSEWVNEKFYTILNGRMIKKQITIFTSNCEMERLRFDDRITNRIFKMALPVPFPDESVRASIAKAENRDLYKKLLGG
jgi:DNA replication protein DnaC